MGDSLPQFSTSHTTFSWLIHPTGGRGERTWTWLAEHQDRGRLSLFLKSWFTIKAWLTACSDAIGLVWVLCFLFQTSGSDSAWVQTGDWLEAFFYYYFNPSPTFNIPPLRYHCYHTTYLHEWIQWIALITIINITFKRQFQETTLLSFKQVVIILMQSSSILFL